MDEKEYLDLLDALINDINPDTAPNIIKKLDYIAEIKPTRAKWFAAQALAMFKSGYKPKEIFEVLSDKYWGLYNYNGVVDCLNVHIQLVKSYNYALERDRVYYYLCAMRKWSNTASIKESQFLDEIISSSNQAYQTFIDSREFKPILTQIIHYSFIQQDLVLYIIYMTLAGENIESRPWVLHVPNMGELVKRLEKDTRDAFIIVCSDTSNLIRCKAVAKALSLLKKQVYFIDLSIPFKVETLISLEDTLQVSLDNREISEYLTVIHPIELIYKNESLGCNIEYIVDYLNRNELKDKHALLLSSGYFIDQLCQNPLLQKQMGRLYGFQTDYLENNLSFAWCGSYLAYISSLYCFSAQEAICTPAQCQFSIIIPARNSAETLRHTIKTCMEQTYKGSYEIVISDNSTGQNAEVYALCKEFNDPRIVYIKTPRDLQLAKSFEFAFLHAKGEYIFSIGSDDGVLPWALETLDKIVHQYPDEEIIQWERGFYAWPGFNGGQQNQFIIPRRYTEGEYGCYYRDRSSYIASVLKEKQAMYVLPMLYINSCFKRSYFNILLEKTGRLWDWACQDIYMGVITSCIHPVILNLEYPLTIAGMSSGSVGAKSNRGTITTKEFQELIAEGNRDHNLGGFCLSYLERYLPFTRTDTWSLYCSFLRAISIGVLPERYLYEVLDWKRIFTQLGSELDIRDVSFDRKIHEMRYAAMLHGDEFLRWFDETIYHKSLIPRKINNKKIEELRMKKSYKEGELAMGGVVLDASKYQVNNIYDAVKLFEKLIIDNKREGYP